MAQQQLQTAAKNTKNQRQQTFLNSALKQISCHDVCKRKVLLHDRRIHLEGQTYRPHLTRSAGSLYLLRKEAQSSDGWSGS